MSPSPEIHSQFMEFMLEHNRPRMDGFKSWVFHPGMLFQALGKWWGDQGLRAVPHEGLDLYSFEDCRRPGENRGSADPNPGGVCRSGGKNRPGFSGKIHLYKPCDLYCRWPSTFVRGWDTPSPEMGCKTGQQVAAGEIIAAVAGFPGKKTNLPPHLHLTFAWVPVDFSAGSAYLEKSGP